jgi:hypothetical protein
MGRGVRSAMPGFIWWVVAVTLASLSRATGGVPVPQEALPLPLALLALAGGFTACGLVWGALLGVLSLRYKGA